MYMTVLWKPEFKLDLALYLIKLRHGAVLWLTPQPFPGPVIGHRQVWPGRPSEAVCRAWDPACFVHCL